MGLKYSPDIAQAVMENNLFGIDVADMYVDDVGAFSSSWEHHVALLSIILHCLNDNRFIMNPRKCEWAVCKTDWLDYWLTPYGLKPRKKMIIMIMNMQYQYTYSDHCRFIGCVNWYCDM
jgi:hypothetical protein